MFLRAKLSRKGPNRALLPETALDEEFDFATSAARCQTQNEFNRLTITLENVLTPAEIASIAGLDLAPKTRERTDRWIAKLSGWQPDVFHFPQNYQRFSVSAIANCYRGRGGVQRDRNLVVAFCGNAGRLMIPAFVFLQAFDARVWNILLVRKQPSATSYLQGAKGIADNFPGIVRHLVAKVHPAQYRRIVTVGTSAGGFFAVWTAALLGAERAIAVGGCLPRALPDLTEIKPALTDIDLRMVYSGDFPRDHERALAMQSLLGGQLVPVTGIAQHNVLAALMIEGKLVDFLGELVV